MAFSKFKALLRAAAARTISVLWEAIRIALDAFTPSECQKIFSLPLQRAAFAGAQDRKNRFVCVEQVRRPR
jgi:hypothetical protein